MSFKSNRYKINLLERLFIHMKIRFGDQFYSSKFNKTRTNTDFNIKHNHNNQLILTTQAVLNSYGKYITFKGKVHSTNSIKSKNNDINVGKKLELLREQIKQHDLDALIVRSSDDYLNEYVNKKQSQREYISEFTGSYGEVLITADSADLIVDNRYHLQAEQQVNSNYYKVQKAGIDEKGHEIPEDVTFRLATLLKKMAEKNGQIKVGYDPNKVSIKDQTYLKHLCNKVNTKVKFIPTEFNLVDKVRGNRPEVDFKPIIEIPEYVAGESVQSKLQRLHQNLKKFKVDLFIVNKLCDISYLTNLRGNDIPYTSTFHSKAIFNNDKLTVFCDISKIPDSVKLNYKNVVEFKPEEKFYTDIENICSGSHKPLRIGFREADINAKTYLEIIKQKQNHHVIVEIMENPIAEMRARKNPTELKHYAKDIKLTDKVMKDVIDWVNSNVVSNKNISEADLQDYVELTHKRYGASGLSFPIMPQSGENTEKAHYTQGNPEKFIKPGELIMLDTGAYYKSGLATDLTRTWIAGGEEGFKILEKQDPEKLKEIKKAYSVILKSLLNLMYKELPPGMTGKYIEMEILRSCNKYGYDMEYGIGHGTGVDVHEFPPYIDTIIRNETDNKLEEGMTFAIEPGIYKKGLGGIRLENILVVKKHSDDEKAKHNWHQLDSLSFAPIDYNLLDKDILDETDMKRINDWLSNQT